MQLPITGGTYEQVSRDVNYQRCLNMFPSLAGLDKKKKVVLLPTPGLLELVDLGTGPVRAIMEDNSGNIYAIGGNTVYKITLDSIGRTATAASIGTIGTNDSPISWDVNPTQIMFVDGSPTGGYIITTATDTLAQITDSDFTGGDTVTFMDSYFIYNTPDAANMYATDSNNGASVKAAAFSTAEGRPDNLVAVLSDKRELWAFGDRSVEIWYNAANPTGFPFTRREGAYIDIGCAAKLSVLRFNNTVVWLDNRGYVVQANGYTPQIISNEAISAEIQSYATVSDAVAFKSEDRGHLFYILSFPTEKKTWVYDATTNLWHERAYRNPANEFEHHLTNCHWRTSQLNLIGSRTNGKIYIQDHIYYDDDSEPIHRIRTTSHQKLEFTMVGVDSLNLHLESGQATQSGDGNDPQVSMRYSNDGGHTWSHHLARSFGKVGQYGKQVRWNRLGVAREWLFEFSIVEPIKFAIIDASVNISGGRDG